MSANREVKMKEALITELVELLESTGLMRAANKDEQSFDAFDVLGAHTIVHDCTKTNLALTQALARRICSSGDDVQQKLYSLQNSTDRILDLTNLTLQQLQAIKTKFKDLVSECDNNNVRKGVCERNKVIYYLSNIEHIHDLEVGMLREHLKNISPSGQRETTDELINASQKTAIESLAKAVNILSSNKHKHRALAALIITAIALTAPVLGMVYLSLYLDGNKSKGKLSTGMRVANFVSNHLKEASALSRASKSITLFCQPAVKAAEEAKAKKKMSARNNSH